MAYNRDIMGLWLYWFLPFLLTKGCFLSFSPCFSHVPCLQLYAALLQPGSTASTEFFSRKEAKNRSVLFSVAKIMIKMNLYGRLGSKSLLFTLPSVLLAFPRHVEVIVISLCNVIPAEMCWTLVYLYFFQDESHDDLQVRWITWGFTWVDGIISFSLIPYSLILNIFSDIALLISYR